MGSWKIQPLFLEPPSPLIPEVLPLFQILCNENKGPGLGGVSGSQFSVKLDFLFRGPLSQVLGLFRSASLLLLCCARDLVLFLGETECYRFRFASQCTMGYSFKAHHALRSLPGRNGQGPSSPGNSTVTPSSPRDSLLSTFPSSKLCSCPFLNRLGCLSIRSLNY